MILEPTSEHLENKRQTVTYSQSDAQPHPMHTLHGSYPRLLALDRLIACWECRYLQPFAWYLLPELVTYTVVPDSLEDDSCDEAFVLELDSDAALEPEEEDPYCLLEYEEDVDEAFFAAETDLPLISPVL